jgi:hypothetical protein
MVLSFVGVMDESAEIRGPKAVEDAAIQWVMDYERSRGREPADTRHRGTPADIASSGRTIEVKAFGGSARGSDLWLETRQVEEARANPAFFIYVIENVRRGDPAKFTLKILGGTRLRKLLERAKEQRYYAVRWPVADYDLPFEDEAAPSSKPMNVDGLLVPCLEEFERLFESKAGDPDWYPSEDAARQCLVQGLRRGLGGEAAIQSEHFVAGRRIDIWVESPPVATELKFHRGSARPLTQQYGALLVDCRKLANLAGDMTRLLVLVTDDSGDTHLKNKGILPSSPSHPRRLVRDEHLKSLAATATAALAFEGTWIPIDVSLLWSSAAGSWRFFAWKIDPLQEV